MARRKATIMLDRGKAERIRTLTGASSVSDAVEVALDRYLRQAELRNDVAAYLRVPPTADEAALGDIPVRLDLDDDEIDYDALYGRPD